MGRMYTAAFTSVTVSAAQDLFELLAATGKRIRVHAWMLTQSSEVGDAAEEMLELLVKRGVGSTSGSGGSSPTPAPQNVDDAAAGATVETNNTTKMTSGTITTLEAHAWNIRAPFMMIYTPEMRPHVKPGDRLTIELVGAPADAVELSGTIWFDED